MNKKMIGRLIAKGDKKELEKAIGETLPEVLNEYGETPLMWAIRFGYTTDGDDIFKMILNMPQDLNKKDSIGFSALSYALSLRRPAFAEALIEKGADVNVPCKIAIAPHPRAYAAHKAAFLSHAIKPYPVEKDQILHPISLAIYKSYDDLVYKMIDAGGNLDTVGGLDITPLSISIRTGKLDVLQYLLERGANPNVLPKNWSNYGVKPESICPVAIKKALKYGCGASISLLLKAGSRLPKLFLRRDNFYSTPLTYLFSQPKEQLAEPYYCLRQLQKRFDISVCDSDNRSPLSYAIENNFDDYLISSLLHEKVNNLKDKFACTPMIYAWLNKDTSVMKILYNAGVPMASNVYEPTGQTLLMMSIEKKDYQMVDFLMKHSPMLLTKDSMGRSVLSYIDETMPFFQEISKEYQVQQEKMKQYLQRNK